MNLDLIMKNALYVQIEQDQIIVVSIYENVVEHYVLFKNKWVSYGFDICGWIDNRRFMRAINTNYAEYDNILCADWSRLTQAKTFYVDAVHSIIVRDEFGYGPIKSISVNQFGTIVSIRFYCEDAQDIHIYEYDRRFEIVDRTMRRLVTRKWPTTDLFTDKYHAKWHKFYNKLFYKMRIENKMHPDGVFMKRLLEVDPDFNR